MYQYVYYDMSYYVTYGRFHFVCYKLYLVEIQFNYLHNDNKITFCHIYIYYIYIYIYILHKLDNNGSKLDYT